MTEFDRNQPVVTGDEPGRSRLEWARTEVQIEHILRSMPDVRVHPADWRQEQHIDFLYHRSRILLHSKITGKLPKHFARGRRVAGGFTIVHTDLHVPVAVEELEKRFGDDVVSPDHLLHVSAVSYCPADEPRPWDPRDGGPRPGLNPTAQDGTGIRVLVIDTGLSRESVQEHPWMAGVLGDAEDSYAGLWSTSGEPVGDILPYAGHGTFVAGVVRAAAPGARVVVRGLLGAQNAAAAFESDIAADITMSLARFRPHIISLSAGGTTRDNRPLLSFQTLYDTRWRHLDGTVFVAAAGNDGRDDPFWPAAFPWVVGVGALTEDEAAPTTWSNWGAWVNVWARGAGHVNAFLRGGYVTKEPQTPAGLTRTFEGMAGWQGTSFATPLVSGTIARAATRSGLPVTQAWDSVFQQAEAVQAAAAGLPGPAVLVDQSIQTP